VVVKVGQRGRTEWHFDVVDMAGRCYSLSLVQQVVMYGELGMCRLVK